MDMTEMVIEVNGIPDNYPEKSMIDKLTIHFLRRSNNGGDVSIVIYPTSNKGQAYVIFEKADVPGLLKHTHVLDVDSEFYPLEVKKVNQPQMDMPAEAVLNISMFSSHRTITNLLHSHEFRVSETGSGKLLVQGSFLKLNLIYPKVMQLLAQESHAQERTPSHYTNGYSSDPRAASSDYDPSNYVTTRRRKENGNSLYAEGRSTSSGMNSRYPESPDRLAFLQASSQHNGHSSTESSFSSPSRSYEDSRSSNQKWSLSPKQTKNSFPVKKDAFEYIYQFKEDLIEKMKSDYHTDVSYDSKADSGLVTVTVSGGDWEEATKELSELIRRSSLSLYTQTIDLNELDSRHKKFISQKANSFQKIYTVLIRQEDDIIKVVGSLKDSSEAKQALLRKKVDVGKPKPMERSLFRRSSSLSRIKTRSKMDTPDFSRSPDTTVSSSSAPRSPTDSQVQRDGQQERGRSTSRSSEQRSRAHSASRMQHKNHNKVEREQSNTEQQDLTYVEVPKSKQKPKMLHHLITFDKLTHLRLKKKSG